MNKFCDLRELTLFETELVESGGEGFIDDVFSTDKKIILDISKTENEHLKNINSELRLNLDTSVMEIEYMIDELILKNKRTGKMDYVLRSDKNMSGD